MKAQELRSMSAADLDKQVLELRKEQFALRMQQGTGQLSRPSRVKVVRREIARIKTIRAEITSGGQAGSAK